MENAARKWTKEEAGALMALPFNDLLFQAQTIQRANFDPNAIQTSTLLNIKTGACPEDCAYCSQSARYQTGLERESLMACKEVVARAREAKAAGATRFCMGAAWRNPTDKNLSKVIEMIIEVKKQGLETCATLGMLTPEQANALSEAGLDYYNHNLDTSEEHYPNVITTRTFVDRIETLEAVADAGINVCCGGIIGLGENREDRASMLAQLANLKTPPKSVPINRLIPIPGTPLADAEAPDEIEFIRTIATARIMLPHSYVRLAAGRVEMSETLQTLCFFAGANSIFYGERLLTTDNPDTTNDKQLLNKLGLRTL